jgi:hypothetical protein
MNNNRGYLVPFINLGHFVDHLAMLVFPTVVVALAREWQQPYSELLPMALGGFIAFGAFALPAGWLADHWSRYKMMVVFFLGIGAALFLTGFAQSSWQIGAGLFVTGMFAAIYHPVGIAMLVAAPEKMGRALGWNGLWGNLGLAGADLRSPDGRLRLASGVLRSRRDRDGGRHRFRAARTRSRPGAEEVEEHRPAHRPPDHGAHLRHPAGRDGLRRRDLQLDHGGDAQGVR